MSFYWNNNGLDGWLDAWWSSHASDIAANSRGFAGAFGEWAIGNPDWSCRDDGSTDDCDFNACNNAVLNAKGNETRQAYCTMESINRLHTSFTGPLRSPRALSKDSWATTFYKDKDVKAVKSGWGNPGAAGASWEGVFTIPVCDVGWAVTGDIADKQHILQPLGKDYRPHWCGLSAAEMCRQRRISLVQRT
ncbi:MAG: hypothetical protein Q9210_002717 [Variospora velana]